MIGTILTCAAPLAGFSALIGLWQAGTMRARQFWRTLAVIISLASTAVMGLAILPMDTSVAWLAADTELFTALFYGMALVLGSGALLIDEYRRPLRVHRNRAASFLTDVARELASDEPLDTMLVNIGCAFRRDAEADAVHIFKISERKRTASRVGTAASTSTVVLGFDEVKSQLLTELAWWASHEDSPAIVDDDDGHAQYTVPIRDGRKPYALLILQHPRREMSPDWIAAAGMIGRTISQWCELTQYRDTGIAAQRMREVMPQLMQEGRLESSLDAVGYTLREVVDYDYLSISSMGGSREHEDRVSTVVNSDRVIESRRRWPVSGATLRRVIATGHAVITPDLDMADEDELAEQTPWERRLGMRSRLIVPIMNGARVIGTMTLGHRSFACYSEADTTVVSAIGAFVAPWLAQLEASRLVTHREQVIAYLRHLEDERTHRRDEVSLVRDASNVIDVTGLRVFRYREERSSLREVASAGRLPDGQSPYEIPLSQLPWHRWALDCRRTLTINQADPESMMSPKEACLAMDERMKTGCLVPIVADGRALGVIDVVEQRHPDRTVLDPGSKLVLEKLADVLAERWFMPETTSAEPRQPGGRMVVHRLKEWSRQVVNPLTSIIGSVELIRHRESALRPDTSKYLGTIEKSAGRIYESLIAMIEEAGRNMSDSERTIPYESWTWTRGGESAPVVPNDFTRPASVSEAAASELSRIAMRRESDTAEPVARTAANPLDA